MKILHINTKRIWRGGEQQTLSLLAGLQKRDIACHLVCQPASPLLDKARAADIPVFPICMHGEIDAWAVYRIRGLIKRLGPDIVHSHTAHAHSLAFYASLGEPVARLVTRRVDFSIFRNSFFRLNGLKYRYFADRYIAISQKIKDVLAADGVAADRIVVVPSGIDPERFAGDRWDHLKTEFGIAPEERVVINVAHLAGHKGQTYLVQAIPRVLSRVPGVRFFIVGAGELLAELKAQADSLGLDDRLVLTGFRQDVGAFYHLADLFVMSSVQEGLGTAVLDAMALAKPVVATRAGGIPEAVIDGQTGRLVAAGDPAALAEGIVELLTHPELAGRLGNAARRLVHDRFSVDAMVDGNLAAYQSLLSRSR
jgi:glycosyltransferase involved in cell wall biosynthesis